MKNPFTNEEQEIMDLIVKAHNKFIKIEPTHPSDITDWLDGIHKCQSVIASRIVRRDYPHFFTTIKL